MMAARFFPWLSLMSISMELRTKLRAIGKFLLDAVNELDIAQASNLPLRVSIDLRNSNPSAKVGVSVNAVRYVAD